MQQTHSQAFFRPLRDPSNETRAERGPVLLRFSVVGSTTCICGDSLPPLLLLLLRSARQSRGPYMIYAQVRALSLSLRSFSHQINIIVGHGLVSGYMRLHACKHTRVEAWISKLPGCSWLSRRAEFPKSAIEGLAMSTCVYVHSSRG